MLFKFHKVILAAFKFYNVETPFLPFTVSELKLDSEIRNTEYYYSFQKLIVKFLWDLQKIIVTRSNGSCDSYSSDIICV